MVIAKQPVASAGHLSEFVPARADQIINLQILAGIFDGPLRPRHTPDVLRNGYVFPVPTLVGIQIRSVKIKIAVVIKVSPRYAHPKTKIEHAGFFGHVRECAVMVVAVETFAAGIVGHKDVWVSIVVIVSYAYRQGPSGIARAAQLRDIGKAVSSIVVKQMICSAVL